MLSFYIVGVCLACDSFFHFTRMCACWGGLRDTERAEELLTGTLGYTSFDIMWTIFLCCGWDAAGARVRCDAAKLSADVERTRGERAVPVLPQDRAQSRQARCDRVG